MKYIICDLEATCFKDGRRHRPETIEIGAVLIEDGKIISEFQSFIKPVLNPILSRFCTKLTSITQADVDAATTFPEVGIKFKEWIGENSFTFCSWGSFDFGQLILDHDLHKLDHKWLSTKTHLNVKRLHGALKGLDTGTSQMKATLMEFPTFEGQHHRGIDDARNMANIFVKYFDEFKIH